MLSIRTSSSEETLKLGELIGRIIDKGLYIGLSGELGSGKTVFVKGLSKGLGVPDSIPVTSPTFTLINSYEGRLPLQHADLYRLPESDYISESLLDIGFYDLMSDGNVLVCEWSERLDEGPPDSLLSLQVDFFFDINDIDCRSIDIKAMGLGFKEFSEKLKTILINERVSFSGA